MSKGAKAILGMALLFLSLSSRSGSLPLPLAIHSVQEIHSAFQGNWFFTLIIDCSNDGSQGPVTASVTIKSRDGLVRTTGIGRDPVKIGEHVKVAITIEVPLTYFDRQTDIVRAELKSTNDQSVVAVLNLERKFIWPARTKERSKDRIIVSDWRNLLGYSNAFRGNFLEEAFSANDALLERLLVNKWIDLQGDPQFGWYLHAMKAVFAENNPHAGALIEKWQTAHPTSVGAIIAKALYLQQTAWRIYGGKNNRSPDPLATKLFHERLKLAEQVLLKAKSFSSNNPLWYQVYIGILSDDKRDRHQLDAVFTEGIRKFPTYRPLYLEMARFWVPRFGTPQWEKVNEVLEKALANTAKSDGYGMYALTYIDITNDQLLAGYSFEPFRDSPATWPAVKKSIEDLIRRYPNSDRYKNEYASFACRAGDGATFNAAWFHLGEDFNPAYWYDNFSPDLCKQRFFKHA